MERLISKNEMTWVQYRDAGSSSQRHVWHKFNPSLLHHRLRRRPECGNARFRFPRGRQSEKTHQARQRCQRSRQANRDYRFRSKLTANHPTTFQTLRDSIVQVKSTRPITIMEQTYAAQKISVRFGGSPCIADHREPVSRPAQHDSRS